MSKGYSGYGGTVEIGSTPVDVDVQNWSADIDGGAWDSTTTGDGGWADENPGVVKLSGTFDILYNPEKKALRPTSGTPAGLGIRTNAVVDLKLHISKADGETLSGKALLGKISIKQQTKAGIVLTVSFSNKGPWAQPGDVVEP